MGSQPHPDSVWEEEAEELGLLPPQECQVRMPVPHFQTQAELGNGIALPSCKLVVHLSMLARVHDDIIFIPQ